MGFKIVQTTENNRSVLTIVPSMWVKGESLYWPKKMNETKLIHDEHSVPKTDWKVMRCKLKREYLTLEEAGRELERMEQYSDTENDYDSPAPTPRPTPRPRKSMNTHLLAEVDFNDQIVRDFVASNTPSKSSSPVPIQVTASSSKSHSSKEPTIITIPFDRTPSVNSAVSSGNGSEINSTSNTVQYEIVDINQESNLLHLIYEEQKQIRQQLATLQASVDFIMQNMYQSAPREADQSGSNVIKPATNLQELQKLEDHLKNKNNMSRVIDAMTFICGTSGKAKCLDSCYKLIDYFFSRDLIVNCSWTGTSRKNDENKIPLKYFSNIKNCFLTLVMKSDKDFSEQDCDKFLKTVIKNAKQRLNPKIMSATKHRPNKRTAQERPEQNRPEQEDRNENQAEGHGNLQEIEDGQNNQAEENLPEDEQDNQPEVQGDEENGGE